MQSEETWMELHVLHRHGWSIAALAREFGLDWRTARRYATAPTAPTYKPRARPAELSPAQLAHIERRLAACPDLRATVLHRELCDDYAYTASYSSLRRRVVGLRPTETAEPELRFETGPGVQTQGDWTDCGSWPLGDGTAELHAWVAILGFSRMLAIRFATDRTRRTTLRAIVRCTDDLGGATAEWVDTAASLGTRQRACRPYRAKTKGKVERVIREVKEDFLAWLTGQVLPERPTLADYDALARRWVLDVVARRRHRTTERIVGEAWAEERSFLVPVPRRLVARAEGLETFAPPLATRQPVRPRLTVVDEAVAVEVRPLAVYAERAR